MKKHTKKILSLVLSVVMLFAMNLSVAAASTPTENDSAKITVSGVEPGALVTAYQIVKGEYTNNGFSGYKPVIEGSIKDVTKPTAEEIFVLANKTDQLAPRITMTSSGSNYTASAGVGTWMILVKAMSGQSLEKVYNPMIVSNYYNDDYTVNSGTVSGTMNWTLNDRTTVAKASEPDVTKVIVKDGTEVKGDDVAVGDSISFKVNSTIPSYGSEYKKVVYNLTDELSTGLTLNSGSVQVKVNGQTVNQGAGTYTLTETANGYKIVFAEDYIRANGQKAVEVTYSATLNEQATSGFDADTNTVTLDYSTNFNGDTSAKKDTTRHYTFGIDSSITGQTGVTDITKTHETIKVAEDTWVEKEYTDEEYTEGVPGALAGAEFTLYKSSNGQLGEVVKTVTTTATGHMEFTGLDAGSYILKETKAPEGYSLDATEHTVEITAEYNTDGTLKSYTILIDGQASNTYEANYAGGTITNITHKDGGTTSIFKNVKLGELPSTGGIGTYIFTIVGAGLMAAAIILLVMRRRAR